MILFSNIFTYILILVFALVSVFAVRKKLTEELSFCSYEMTQLQNKHKKHTRLLFRLNLPAKILRESRRYVSLAYKVAPPPWKAVFFAALQFIKSMQKLLVTAQKAILTWAYLDSTYTFARMSGNLYLPSNKIKSLQVEAYPKKSASPSYRLKKDYTNKKTIEFHKVFRPLSYIPSSLRSFLFNRSIQFLKVKCGSTMTQQKEVPWQAKLILDRF